LLRGKRGSVQEAEVVREYGPFPGGGPVHGVTWDGMRVWFATGEALWALDPVSGDTVRSIPLACDAGTAYDGRYLYQLSADRILKVDPGTGRVLSELPAPGDGASGLTWAEGRLWMGQYQGRRILELDAETGAVVRVLESDRFVTGVTWAEGELWHGTWEGDESELRRVDPGSGLVLARVRMPTGGGVSGLESDGGALFYCGGGRAGTVRAVRRPTAGRGGGARAEARRPGRRRAARSHR
jgi:outer membrane protein assembly factor BamB